MGSLLERTNIRTRCLLVAPLIFSLLCFVQLPHQGTLSLASLDSPLYFLVSYLFAAALTFLGCNLIPSLRTAPVFHLPSLACVLPVLAGIGLTFLFSVAGIGVAAQIPIGAGLMGLGSALVLLMWAQAFMLLEKRELVATTAAAFLLAFLLKLLFDVWGTDQVNLVVMGAAVIISALPLDDPSARPREDSVAQKGIPQIGTTLSEVALQWWKPLFGCVLCCMIWGFSWGNSLMGSPPGGTGAESILITDIGRALGCAALIALSTRRALNPSTGFTLPLAVGLLLLGWILSMIEGFVGTMASGLSSGIGFALFQVAFWIKTCELAEGSPARARLLFGGAYAMLAMVILLGIALAPLIGALGGELITPICSIIFFILLAAMPSIDPETPSASQPQKAPIAEPAGTSPSSPIDALCADHKLSPRETEVFALFVRGHSAKFIAEELVVSLHTVKTHIKRIYEKMDVHSKDELIALADTSRKNRESK